MTINTKAINTEVINNISSGGSSTLIGHYSALNLITFKQKIRFSNPEKDIITFRQQVQFFHQNDSLDLITFNQTVVHQEPDKNIITVRQRVVQQ